MKKGGGVGDEKGRKVMELIGEGGSGQKELALVHRWPMLPRELKGLRRITDFSD